MCLLELISYKFCLNNNSAVVLHIGSLDSHKFLSHFA